MFTVDETPANAVKDSHGNVVAFGATRHHAKYVCACLNIVDRANTATLNAETELAIAEEEAAID